MPLRSSKINASLIVPENQALSESEFKDKWGIKAYIGGTATASIPVTNGAKPLVEYLRLPASMYSTNVMGGINKSIKRIDDTNFLFETESVSILGTVFQPFIVAEVIVDKEMGGTTIEVKSIHIKTSDPKVQSRIDKSFTISCTNAITWEKYPE